MCKIKWFPGSGCSYFGEGNGFFQTFVGFLVGGRFFCGTGLLNNGRGGGGGGLDPGGGSCGLATGGGLSGFFGLNCGRGGGRLANCFGGGGGRFLGRGRWFGL